MLFLFSFYSPHHHRALHSFPTRRSSDLLSADSQMNADENLPHQSRRHPLHHLAELPRAEAFGEAAHHLLRSEEHTSELQSPYDPVCRLLLEKKNPPNHHTLEAMEHPEAI